MHYNIFPGTLKLLGPPKILLIISISGNTKCKYENDVYLHTYNIKSNQFKLSNIATQIPKGDQAVSLHCFILKATALDSISGLSGYWSTSNKCIVNVYDMPVLNIEQSPENCISSVNFKRGITHTRLYINLSHEPNMNGEIIKLKSYLNQV